jgi:hypothetical protein
VRPVGRAEAHVRGPALADSPICIGAGEGALPEGAEVTGWLLGGG